MVTNPAKNIGCNAVRCLFYLLLIGFSQQCGEEMPTEYQALFRLPSHEREARFREFPLEKQVDVYIYAMYVEPPMTEFLRYLASNGEAAIPYLIARLETETSDTRKKNLIYVFEEMHRYHVSLSDKRKTVTTLEGIVSNMKDDYNKKKAQEALAVLKTTPGVQK